MNDMRKERKVDKEGREIKKKRRKIRVIIIKFYVKKFLDPCSM